MHMHEFGRISGGAGQATAPAPARLIRSTVVLVGAQLQLYCWCFNQIEFICKLNVCVTFIKSVLTFQCYLAGARVFDAGYAL